jgi:hypothetical protein
LGDPGLAAVPTAPRTSAEGVFRADSAVTIQELDPTDDDDVATHRSRARKMLDQIAQQAKQALTDQGIGIDVFFLIPSSGNSVLIFGTPADPADVLWNEVGKIVSAIVRQSVGLAGTRCRAMACATTQDQECCDAAG